MSDRITQEQAERYRDAWGHSAAQLERLDGVLQWISDQLSEQCDYDLEDEFKRRWRDALSG